MNKVNLSIRLLGIAAAVVLIGLLVATPAAAYPLRLDDPTPEPTPRPTIVPSPFIEISPSEAVAGEPLPVSVTGYFWPAGGPGVMLAFDQVAGDRVLAGPIAPNPDGFFAVQVVVPADWAMPGVHRIIAVDNQGGIADAALTLVIPTATSTPPPTDTPLPTDTPPPTDTPAPTRTPTPITPTATRTATPTFTATRPFRDITPQMTATSIPRTTARPTSPRVPTSTPTPNSTSTATPTATGTTTELPRLLQTLTFTPSPTASPSATPEPSATPQVTPTVALDVTPTGSVPLVVTAAEGPGLPMAGGLQNKLTLEDMRLAIVLVLLGGIFFALFTTVLVAGLLVTIRVLRARGLLPVH